MTRAHPDRPAARFWATRPCHSRGTIEARRTAPQVREDTEEVFRLSHTTNERRLGYE
ncbi:hypothetical protein [Novosphingobium sp. SG720]|uniref:hypothetical protein n=1 Tax=Novosphingobium sp. SG720 TaxID=2586998 RepID=UPI0014467642|nr:hypothetical protein [Novosphingobium sp. SG720]NKJ44223.1 hypothetical protein [Novosphingobium sp. SG720]